MGDASVRGTFPALDAQSSYREAWTGDEEVEVKGSRMGGEAEVVALGPAVPNNPALPETVIADLEELGLNGSQARVLLAMLSAGTANGTEIALLSGVPRTAVYPLLQQLAARRLVAQVGSDGPATWACPGRDEVLERLQSAQEERIARQRAHTDRLRSTLSDLFPPAPSSTLPFVHFIPGPGQVKDAYNHLLNGTASELLVFSRPPYPAPPGPMNPRVTDLVQRGVQVRALFQSSNPALSTKQVSREIEAYREAGIETRLVDRLPVKLVIADRKVVLVAIPDPNLRDTGFPTSLLVENEDYANLHATAFEGYWAEATLPAG